MPVSLPASRGCTRGAPSSRELEFPPAPLPDPEATVSAFDWCCIDREVDLSGAPFSPSSVICRGCGELLVGSEYAQATKKESSVSGG